ncbi:MAG: tetratricopeptide repeat protein [Deltaproteobacteria bacterium]|nr:tetratricopeptide repeat protein [Deltaproteobacteria bacterium]
MECPKCRFENPHGMKFCGRCGNKLEAVCPRRGFRNPPRFKFCESAAQTSRHPMGTDTDEARVHFKESIDAFEKLKAENHLALAYAGYGPFCKQQGRFEEAMGYLTRALKILDRLGTLIEPDKIRQDLSGLPKG